jgi:cytosine/adenosine deaminase-related metal-dependent hydrolase
MTGYQPNVEFSRGESLLIHGARCALGPGEAAFALIETAQGRIKRIQKTTLNASAPPACRASVDLSGYLLMPGLVNAHDHLEFSLYPRLADPPYSNYIEWGKDIHEQFPDEIATARAVPRRIRLWWGAIRNLLSGVTTVCHHNPLWPELQRNDFPIRVVSGLGWAHSVGLSADLVEARAATPHNRPFIVHACEGVDTLAHRELFELDELGILDANAVLVHGLAIDDDGVELLRARNASLIVCPSSNHFLFGKRPDMATLRKLGRVALGNDSPLTAVGDLLDEVRFAMNQCEIPAADAYRMVTTVAAECLRLENCEGSLRESGVADLVAIRDTGASPAERLETLTMEDVELVIIESQVQLASQSMLERLPPSTAVGLQRLVVGEVTRWARAPVNELLFRAEEVLGKGGVVLGGRIVRAPAFAEAEYAF